MPNSDYYNDRRSNRNEVPLEIRGAIVALSTIAGFTQCRIAEALYLLQPTISAILAKSREQTTEEDGPLGQFKYLRPAPRPGRPELILEGSEVSLNLAATALMDEEHQKMTFPEIAQELGINVARSTLENVMHKHHKVYRRTPRIKPALSPQNKKARAVFAHWALANLDEDPSPLFVFTDQSWINLGQGRRRRRKISRPVGSNPWDYSRPRNKPEVSVMFWGAIFYGKKGPFWIWEKESVAERQEMDALVAEERELEEERVQQLREDACTPGTVAYKELERSNTEQAQRRTPVVDFRKRASIKFLRLERSIRASELPEGLTGSETGKQSSILSYTPGSCNFVVRIQSERSG